MRIVFAGSGWLGMGVMNALLDSSHEVVGILRNGRARQNRPLSLRQRLRRLWRGIDPSPPEFAEQLGIPVLDLTTMGGGELAEVAALQPDLILVSGFSLILKQDLLKIPRIGCVNTHSSLLPRHRGPNPFAAVVLAGETESAVTFHVMTPGIDDGDILKQIPFAVLSTYTAVDVYQRACAIAADNVMAVLDNVEANGLAGTPQDASGAAYDKRPNEPQRRIDWAAPASHIDRLVRAMWPNEPAWFNHRGRCIHVLRAHGNDAPVDHAPGTVLTRRPTLSIAVNPGTVFIDAAALGAYRRIPWPNLLQGPRRGEILK